MDITRRNFPEIGQPGGPFCHAVRAGNMLYISGATAGGSDAAQGTAAQSKVVLKRLRPIFCKPKGRPWLTWSRSPSSSPTWGSRAG